MEVLDVRLQETIEDVRIPAYVSGCLCPGGIVRQHTVAAPAGTVTHARAGGDR